MTPFVITLTASAALCGVAAAVFCVLYAQTRRGKRRSWWQTTAGVNVMLMAGSIFVLCLGTVIRLIFPCHYAGELVLLIGHVLVGTVMVWRTVMMWRANHPADEK